MERLHIEITRRLRVRLGALRQETEADSVTEVVRRALSLYELLVPIIKGGKARLILLQDDGKQTEVFLV